MVLKLNFTTIFKAVGTDYTDLEGWSNQVEAKHRDKIFRLSEIYPIYDWVSNDGYNNFKKWID